MCVALKLGFQSLATLKLVVNVGEFFTAVNSCSITRFLCDSMAFLFVFVCIVWCVDNVEMADLKKLEEDALGFAQQAISFDQQGLCDMAFFYYCVHIILLP